jgi:hypothetical protein
MGGGSGGSSVLEGSSPSLSPSQAVEYKQLKAEKAKSLPVVVSSSNTGTKEGVLPRSLLRAKNNLKKVVEDNNKTNALQSLPVVVSPQNVGSSTQDEVLSVAKTIAPVKCIV